MKNNSKFKKILLLVSLLFIYILIFFISYATTVTSDLSNSVFRLHVIANSNSEEDQNLKYLVRDSLLNYMSSICENISTKEEAMELAKNNIQKFQEIAESVIIENGYDYSVCVEVGNYSFPTKKYGDISLPAGLYDALRVKIGSASGENWWCVMFPSLCFVDVSNGYVPAVSKQNLQDSLLPEEYNLISSNNMNFKIKFKLIELFEKANITTAKK